MLELTVHNQYDKTVLQFEHSLLSLSKWEAKYQKAFLSRSEHQATEMIDYFQCMLISPGVDPDLVYALSPEQLEELTNYISSPQTASSVPQDTSAKSNETVTSELIYYWLVGLKIPFYPTETWHLNRVMMLVQIANFKQQPPKKQRASEMMAKIREANEARKKQYGTTG